MNTKVSKGVRRLLWILGGLAVIVIIAAIALQVAISRNGPAVLSAVDYVTGASQTPELSGKEQATISTGAHPQQKLVIWGPERRDPADAPLPVLLFAHGGSWRSGDPVDYGFIGRTFVAEGFIVVLSGYRLGEDGKYPAMLEDTASAIAWTHKEIASYGGDPDRVVIAGHSAGAYNVVTTALEEQWLGRRGLSSDAIAGVIGLSGPYDFVPFDSESTIASFGHVDDPAATQPITHARLDGPPMLLIHGDKDTLVYPRNTRVLTNTIDRMRADAAENIDWDETEFNDDQRGSVVAHFYAEMEHNDPLISIAAPWRSRRDIADVMAEFARTVPSAGAVEAETSVPVQGETR